MTVSANKRETIETKARHREAEMADIEMQLEMGESSIAILSRELAIDDDRVKYCIRKLIKSGAVMKLGDRMINSRVHTMYALTANSPRQQSLMNMLEVKRDSLVAAFFGERTCVTP